MLRIFQKKSKTTKYVAETFKFLMYIVCIQGRRQKKFQRGGG